MTGSGHEGHDHGGGVDASNVRRIRLVFILTTGYALVQAVGGWLSGSLALIADSGHMVSDAAALLLALIAYRVAARAPDATRTYGFHRVRVLAALANGASLLLLVIWIAWEAVQRVGQPIEVLAGPMLIIACIGFSVNVIGALVLARGNRGDANLKGALLHVMGDLLGSVGAIAAAIGIMLTGWMFLDPLLSVLVAVLVVRSAWSLVSDSLRVLLQAVPQGLDARAAEADLATLPGVASAGHFHARTLTDQSAVATVHVVPVPGADPLTLPALVAARLREQFDLDHVTVQVDPGRQCHSAASLNKALVCMTLQNSQIKTELSMTDGPHADPAILAAFVVALAATLGALFIGEVLGQTPCVLCWYQRIAMFPLALILGVAAFVGDDGVRRYALPLALAGGAVALWHSGLYAGVLSEAVAPCTREGPSCTDAAMTILGLPIPYLSLAAFVGITLCLFATKGTRA